MHMAAINLFISESPPPAPDPQVFAQSFDTLVRLDMSSNSLSCSGEEGLEELWLALSTLTSLR